MAKVLIADDDTHLCEAVRGRLEELGYDVLVAPTGEAALTLVREALPSVLLIDQTLPDMSGVEFLNTLQQNPDLSDRMMTVVVLAETDDTEVAAEVQKREYEYWSKMDHTLDELVAYVNRSLSP